MQLENNENINDTFTKKIINYLINFFKILNFLIKVGRFFKNI